MPPLDPLAGNSAHLKACWVDVTDPKEQAYADRRRKARLEAMQAAINTSADATLQQTS
jgi:hypothetical protein